MISFVINFGKYDSIRTLQRTLYVNGDKATYFDTFEVEYIQKKKKEKTIGNKTITANIYRIQANDSIMCEFFWNGFMDFMLKGKSLLVYNSLFFSID